MQNNPESPNVTKRQIKLLFTSLQPFEYEYFLSGIDCEGLAIQWFDNGHKRMESTYGNGGLQGDFFRYYYENGSVRQHWHYKNDMKNGKEEDFAEDGRLIKLCWWKNNKQDGECQEWWENGNKCKHGWYKEGKRHGEYWWWDEDGETVMEHSIYINGEQDQSLLKNDVYTGDLIHW
jgi:hypothetical protein